MNIDERQLENFIVDSGIVSRDGLQELKKTAEEKKLPLSEVAVQRGLLSDDDVRRIQAYLLGLPFVSLVDKELDLAVLSMIPEPISRSHNVVAYKKGTESLEVAMLNVSDLASLDFIAEKMGLKIIPRLTDSESMKWALLSYQKGLRLSFGELIQKELENTDLVVDTLLKHALLQGASDVHIEPEETQTLVRYRLGGFLYDAMTLPKNVGPAIVAHLKSLSGLRPVETGLPQDGRFRLEADGERTSFRFSSMPTASGEKVALRVFRENVSGFTLESLGFHGESLEEVHQALRSKAGLILVAGGAGSGKTTTLYTLLDLVNQPSLNISSVEDSVEYRMPRVNQMAVRPELGLTYVSGLRTLVRQDSDVILVGEIREAEVANLVLQTPPSGRLVFSALEALSSSGAISQLLEMKVDPQLLTSSLKLVVAQGLVRRLADNREKYFLNKEELQKLGQVASLPRVLQVLKQEKVVGQDATWEKIPFYKAVSGKGSEEGYAGYIGIYEVLRLTPMVKELVKQGATGEEIEKEARAGGLITLVEDGLFKAVQGLTSIDEVLRVTSLRL